MDRSSTALKSLVNPSLEDKCFLCNKQAVVGLQNFLWCGKCAAEHLSETLKHLIVKANRASR